MAYPYHRIQGCPRAPNPTSDRRTARPHAQVQAPQKRTSSPAPRQAEGRPGPGRLHDSPPGDDNPKMTHHDSPPGDENPPMTQNDSLCKAPNPEMTQNDSLCKASMPQMSQNDSHFEVSSFEMTQNCPKMTHFIPTPTPPDTLSPELTSRQRPRLPHKMTHPSDAISGPGVIRPSAVGAGPLPSRGCNPSITPDGEAHHYLRLPPQRSPACHFHWRECDSNAACQ